MGGESIEDLPGDGHWGAIWGQVLLPRCPSNPGEICVSAFGGFTFCMLAFLHVYMFICWPCLYCIERAGACHLVGIDSNCTRVLSTS